MLIVTLKENEWVLIERCPSHATTPPRPGRNNHHSSQRSRVQGQTPTSTRPGHPASSLGTQEPKPGDRDSYPPIQYIAHGQNSVF
jgi:hypothetical protein